MLFSNNNLYAGGDVHSAGGSSVNNIAEWSNGSWSALGNGIPGVPAFVYALEGFNNDIYAGGMFSSAGMVPANGVARWDGANWSSLGKGLTGSSNYAWALKVFT